MSSNRKELQIILLDTGMYNNEVYFFLSDTGWDYEAMWKAMKDTYEKRVVKLESEGKKCGNAWISAKRFVDVMEAFELAEKEKQAQ